MIPTVQHGTGRQWRAVKNRSWLPLVATACGLLVSPPAQAQQRLSTEAVRVPAAAVPALAGSTNVTPRPTTPAPVRKAHKVQASISSTATGGNWSSPATWAGGVVPTATDDVTVAGGATVTVDVAASCASLTINSAGSLLTSGTTPYQVQVGGSVTNNGTLDLSASSTVGSELRFTGAGNASFSGSGTTDLQTMTLAKSARTDVVEMSLPTLTVKGSASTTDGFLLTRTTGTTPVDDMTGTLKISGTNTVTNRVFGNSASYIIPATGGFWLNNPNFTVLGQTGSGTVNGLLRISAGTYNVGTGSGNSLVFGSGAVYTMEGGTLTAAGRFGSFTSATAAAAMTFTLSAGTINVANVANASGTPSFGVNGTSTVSGGSINLVQRSTATTPLDYYVAGTYNATGGTLNPGTAATATNFDFRIRGNVPNMSISSGKSVLLAGQTNSYGTVLINVGGTLNLNGNLLLQLAPAVTNNGTLTGTATNSNLYFAGAVAQVLNGSGTFQTVRSLSIDNIGGGVTLAVPLVVSRVNLFSGSIINSGNLTVGDGTAVLNVIQSGATGSGSRAATFDVAPNFNIGAGVLQLLYAPESTGHVTGFEVPPSRIIDYLTIDNPNGVTLAGGNLTVRGDATQSLFLTSGVLSTSATSTLILAETVGAPPTGSATSFVRGPLAITVNSTTPVSRTFAIGDGPGWRPVVLGGITTSGAQTFTATIVSGATGGSLSGGLSALNPTRYVRIQNTAALPTSATVQLSYGGDDVVGGTLTSVVAQAAAANGTYASIGGLAASTPTTGLVSTQPITPGNDFFVLANTEGGSLTSSVASVCSGANSGTLTLSGNVGTITGYEANTGTGFAAVPGTNTGSTLTFTNLTQTTTFRAVMRTADNRVVYSSAVTVTVTPAPTATLTAATPTTFCGSGTLTLNVTPVTGATYQFLLDGQPISGATSATYTATVTASGTYSVVVTSGTCSTTSSAIQVTVSPAASAAFSYANTTFCQSGTNPAPTVTGTAGGTFSSTPGLAIDAATGVINLAASTAGTYTVTYSVGGTCPGSATATVTITNAVTAGFSYTTTTYCSSTAGTVTPTLAAGAASGTFSSTAGLTLDSATGSITPSTSTPGTYTVTNTVAASGGCAAATATTTVTITAPATAGFSYPSTAYCTSATGNTAPVLATGATAGTFSSTAGLTLNPTTGAITPSTSTPGTYTVTNTVAASGACAAVTATFQITITAPATAGFGYAATAYCTSASGTVAPTLASGATAGTFSSTAGLTVDAATGTITPGTSTPGTYTVTNTVSASGGCAAVTATATVTITAPATASFSYAATAYCASATGTVTPTLAAGASAGTFSSTAGLTLNATTGAITPATSTPGTYTVTNTVAASGGCAAVTATATVTITAPATAGFSYANASYCTSVTGAVAPAFASGATAGTFSSTAGLTLDAATGAITPSTSTPGTYTVTNTVAASSGCAAATATFNVTINATPARPTVSVRYNGAVTTLTSSSAMGNQWYLNGTLIPGATGQDYVVNSAAQYGTYTVVVTSTAGCASLASTTQVVTTNLKPLAGTSLTLYPNPTTDGLVTLKLAGYSKAVELTVYNAIGQSVRTLTVPAGRLEQPLDLSQLPTGVYVLKARTEGGLDVRRIVKQ
ncbi:T9SS type A sorting domain-containing protein [Hymenobacter endophyticus]|uniref:T9SS type A sorting domain-containing protein n=1 Tax=Hymenobacter endophyticus TaxID=3076335 RepID=A0ABU3TNE3_9BACT|nr:T9SS type A sorting domain-containing protein [Hymenobacter endophyticus]MDU0372889.1 T9SS type A sorting domain-containing protein [Hymenobacter endophyticus]